MLSTMLPTLFFYTRHKWQYKHNRRKHLHILEILWLIRHYLVSWHMHNKYLWYNVVPTYREIEFGLIIDFQDFKNHSLQGKRISAYISEHSLITFWIQLLSGEENIFDSQYTNTHTHECAQTHSETLEWEYRKGWWIGTRRSQGKRNRKLKAVSDWLTITSAKEMKVYNIFEEVFNHPQTKTVFKAKSNNLWP